MTKEEACVNAIEDLAKYLASADYSYEDAVFYMKSVIRRAAAGNYERDEDE